MTKSLARVTVAATDNASVDIEVVGEIDISNASGLKTRLRSVFEVHQALRLDLTHVTYFDSAGLAIVHELARFARETDRELKLVAHEGSHALRLLRMTGIEEILDIDSPPAQAYPGDSASDPLIRP